MPRPAFLGVNGASTSRVILEHYLPGSHAKYSEIEITCIGGFGVRQCHDTHISRRNAAQTQRSAERFGFTLHPCRHQERTLR